MSRYFSDDNDYLYINVPYAEAYIPEDFFGDPFKKATVASEYGSGIRTVGIFNMRFFNSEDQKRDDVKLVTFIYPNLIETYPSSFIVEKLIINGIEDKYRVLKYERGDIMMDKATRQDTTNCEKFMNMILSGKVPKLKYTDLYNAWITNFDINGTDPSVPAVNMQVIIAEMCRDKEDPVKQFRKVAGKGNVSLYQYMSCNMNEVSSFTSVMAALSFERYVDKMTTSLIMTSDNVKQSKSPVEKVLTY